MGNAASGSGTGSGSGSSNQRNKSSSLDHTNSNYNTVTSTGITTGTYTPGTPSSPILSHDHNEVFTFERGNTANNTNITSKPVPMPIPGQSKQHTQRRGSLKSPPTHTRTNTNKVHLHGDSDIDDDYNDNDDDDEFLTHAANRGRGRPRSNTVSEGTKIPESRNSRVLPTVFKWEGGGKQVKQVYISGTFTEWKTLPMVKSHGDFVTIIDLPEGEHQYKFCVDGEWKHDPKTNLVDNGMGSKNNLVMVKKSDFEVFQALAKDSESVHAHVQKEYSQEIPQSKPWDKVSGPPILPPHLLQVILNKDTPVSCEPTLLPEPNHVMLNHLYALSIKDGVMVLSATHRYRKKYVTTLLYKPIR